MPENDRVDPSSCLSQCPCGHGPRGGQAWPPVEPVTGRGHRWWALPPWPATLALTTLGLVRILHGSSSEAYVAVVRSPEDQANLSEGVPLSVRRDRWRTGYLARWNSVPLVLYSPGTQTTCHRGLRSHPPTIRSVPKLPPGPGWITAPQAAKLLGLQLNSVYHLINRGELAAEVVLADDLPKRRRSIRVRRQAVDDYLERARVKPGELRHLHSNWSWARYG